MQRWGFHWATPGTERLGRLIIILTMFVGAGRALDPGGSFRPARAAGGYTLCRGRSHYRLTRRQKQNKVGTFLTAGAFPYFIKAYVNQVTFCFKSGSRRGGALGKYSGYPIGVTATICLSSPMDKSSRKNASSCSGPVIQQLPVLPHMLPKAGLKCCTGPFKVHFAHSLVFPGWG